jgi:hypothetical protein
VLLRDAIRAPALLGKGLPVVQIIEEFSRVGHGGGR